MRSLMLIFVLAAAASTADAVRCYVCNSHNDTDCLDISPGTKQKFLRDCDTIGDHKYTMCRKIDMYMDMDFGDHPAENRIHRACGYMDYNEKNERTCYYKSGYNTRSWVCSCNSDDCNGVSKTSLTYLTLGAALCIVTAFVRNF